MVRKYWVQRHAGWVQPPGWPLAAGPFILDIILPRQGEIAVG